MHESEQHKLSKKGRERSCVMENVSTMKNVPLLENAMTVKSRTATVTRQVTLDANILNSAL